MATTEEVAGTTLPGYMEPSLRLVIGNGPRSTDVSSSTTNQDKRRKN